MLRYYWRLTSIGSLTFSVGHNLQYWCYLWVYLWSLSKKYLGLRDTRSGSQDLCCYTRDLDQRLQLFEVHYFAYLETHKSYM